MYTIVLNILIFLSLVLIFFQDLKNRQIHVLLPLLLFVCGILNFVNKKIPFQILSQNALFLAITLLITYIYLIIKNKKVINPFKTLIGIGDIIFFIAVLPFFNLKNYIVYFISGMAFSLIGFVIMNVLNKKNNTIPLAGFLALYLMILKILSFYTPVLNFYKSII